MNITTEDAIQTITPNPADALLAALDWRYATKAFDPTRKIPKSDWATLEKALVLSASSFGLQPWKFVVVTNPAVREALLPESWGQRQVIDASHLVVFAVKTAITEAEITSFVERIAATRGIPAASLDGYKSMMTGTILNPAFPLENWVARQAYLALGNLLTSAALLSIDACPMEGFVPEKYDEILGLAPIGYRSAVICTLGYRSAADSYAGLAKVRFSASEAILHI